MAALKSGETTGIRVTGREVLKRLRNQVPFLLFALTVIVAAAAWGVHEIRLTMVRSVLATAWGQRIANESFWDGARDAVRVGGQAAWALISSLIMPGLTIVGALCAGAIRAIGSLFPGVAGRSRVTAWGFLAFGLLMLGIDIIF